jgi:predicted house-cleaning noncanonical NTP pyrophosphatase (MazG superfamily)
LSRIRRFRVEKLIRDGLPAMMRAQGLTVEDRRLDDSAFRAALLDKLVEEAAEARGAKNPDALLEELSDVVEVLRALLAVSGRSLEELEAVRLAKRAARGGFDERVYNAAVSAPDGAPGLDYYIDRPDYPEITTPDEA